MHRCPRLICAFIFYTAVRLYAQSDEAPASTLPSNIDLVTVETSSEENKKIPFYVRIPSGYTSNYGSYMSDPCRILLMCPYLNDDGLKTITGGEANQELLAMADQREWFVVTPTFKAKDPRNKDTSYYYPDRFSGQAVLDALDQISQKYPVDVNHILVQGLSGGAQFSHRFTLWAPDRVVAAAINSSSWFDDPNPACNQVAWMVTIGESDPSFNNTLDFIEKLQDMGAVPFFRSYLGMIHEGDARVVHLDAEFLKYYDEKTHDQLGKPRDLYRDNSKPGQKTDDMPFVGDSQTWKYVPNTPANRERIPEDSRVYLPSKELADEWGSPRNVK